MTVIVLLLESPEGTPMRAMGISQPLFARISRFKKPREIVCLPTSRSDTVVSGRTRRKTGAISGTMGLTSCYLLLL